MPSPRHQLPLACSVRRCSVQEQGRPPNASLGTTVLAMQGDVGSVIANQGKHLGNFADSDFRLFAVGHVAEKFGNGALNIVQP